MIMFQCKGAVAFPLWYVTCPYCDQILPIKNDIFSDSNNIICVCEHCKKRIHVKKEVPEAP